MKIVMSSAKLALQAEEETVENQRKVMQLLKGVGPVLSRRLVEAGYDTIAKVAAAQGEGLARIAGMTPQKARTIATQARNMTGHADKSWHTWADKENQILS